MRAALHSLCFAAALAGSAGAIARADDLAGARGVIEAANRDWMAAMRSGDAAAIAAPYAPDAVFVLPDGRTLTGRTAIEQDTARRFASGPRVVAAELQQEGLQQIAPDLIYEWGRGRTEVVDARGAHRAGEGRYVTVWRRDGSGTWRIVRNLVL